MNNLMTESEFFNNFDSEKQESVDYCLSYLKKQNKLDLFQTEIGNSIFFNRHVNLVNDFLNYCNNDQDEIDFSNCIHNEKFNKEEFEKFKVSPTVENISKNLTQENHDTTILIKQNSLKEKSIKELIELAKGIKYCRRMNKEELIICLCDESKISETINSVIKRTVDKNKSKTSEDRLEAAISSENSQVVPEVDNIPSEQQNATPNTSTNQDMSSNIVLLERVISSQNSQVVPEVDIIPFEQENAIPNTSTNQNTSSNIVLLENVISSENSQVVVDRDITPSNELNETEITENNTTRDTSLNGVIIDSNEANTQNASDERTADLDTQNQTQNMYFGKTYEELELMNGKVLATFLYSNIPTLKYFRRMTKSELLLVATSPERIPELQEIALTRYGLYKDKKYGQNNS